MYKAIAGWLLIIASVNNFCSSQKYIFYVAKKKCSDIGNIGNKSTDTDIVILGPISISVHLYISQYSSLDHWCVSYMIHVWYTYSIYISCEYNASCPRIWYRYYSTYMQKYYTLAVLYKFNTKLYMRKYCLVQIITVY